MKITIIGAGISGLSLAHALLEGQEAQGKGQNLEIAIFESEERPGGKIWTEKISGFLCESGVNGFLDNRPKTLELASRLNLSPIRSSDNARKRYIYSDGKLHLIPESPPAFLKSKLLSLSGKLRIIGELFAQKGKGDDETLQSFAVRRLGKEVYEKLIDPMALGIYAGDSTKLSLKSCFPRIQELERNYGSLIRALIKLQREAKKTGRKVGPGPGGILTSFYDGMSAMVDTLEISLGERIKTGKTVTGTERKNSGFNVHLDDGSSCESDVVVLAAPAHAGAEIISGMDKALSEILKGIQYPPVSVVCIGFKKSRINTDLNGFGFLIPGTEKRKILGTLFDSSIFPNRAPEGYVLLRTMVGGARAPGTALLADEVLIDVVLTELREITGIKAEPDFTKIYRHEKAIPQYVIGHQERLRLIDEAVSKHKGLYLTGNSYRGIGVNDCIENSFKLAEIIIKN